MALVFSIVFYIWGFLGLVASGMNSMALEGTVDIGTLTHLAASNFLWIGGMVLFGFSALISASRSQRRSSAPKTTTEDTTAD